MAAARRQAADQPDPAGEDVWQKAGAVWFAEQNLSPIIDDGELNLNLDDGPEWGETVDNAGQPW